MLVATEDLVSRPCVEIGNADPDIMGFRTAQPIMSQC